jgi:hypothetical protein
MEEPLFLELIEILTQSDQRGLISEFLQAIHRGFVEPRAFHSDGSDETQHHL